MAESLGRRRFLGMGAATGAALAMGSLFGDTAWAQLANAAAPPTLNPTQGTLVLVTLYGGNDGLNTVIPTQDPAYLAARPTFGYPADQVLALEQGLGLHPNLVGFKGLWDAHQLAIVRGVGYPNPNLSHFRSMDIWQSGVPDDIEITGWLGRWLDRTGTDPLRALSVGPNLPRALAGAKTSGAAIPTGPIRLPGSAGLTDAFGVLEHPFRGEPGLDARAAQTGKDLLHVQAVLTQALSATPSKTAAANNANPLGVQLDTVARAINAGVPTRVYAVSLSGFDTHAAQRATQARLLGQLDQAITAFYEALDPTKAAHVVAFIYSEFGRRVAANASAGTDHGTAAPVFLIGPSVHGGFYGDQPSLTDLDNGNLRVTTDYRSIYATLLANVVGVDPTISLRGKYPLLAVV